VTVTAAASGSQLRTQFGHGLGYERFAIAALCGVPLIIRAGWPLLAIGMTSIVAAYAYTGGPYPLAYHGLGELFVLIFFGSLTRTNMMTAIAIMDGSLAVLFTAYLLGL